MTKKVSNYQYDIWVKSQRHLYQNYDRAHNLNSSFIFKWMVFIYGPWIVLQQMFLITAMSLESKDKVKYIYNQFMACYANSLIILSANIAYDM